MWPKLLRSYVIDAVSQQPKGQLSAARATRFLRDAASASAVVQPSVGAGTLYRISGAGASGSALEHQKKVVHMDLFPGGSGELPEDGTTPQLQFRRDRSLR
jgi:hypothetical protein